MNPEAKETVTVKIVCSVNTRYSQDVQMSRASAEELIAKYDDDDDIEDDILGYLDLTDPLDTSMYFWAVNELEIVNETEEEPAE